MAGQLSQSEEDDIMVFQLSQPKEDHIMVVQLSLKPKETTLWPFNSLNLK